MATHEDAYLLRDLTRDLLRAGRLWRKMARHAASRHGVSEAASAPLMWIERLGENVRQNALADAIGIEGASLVRLLDELQASSLITRVPDPADRRANAVNLTDKGRSLVTEVNETLNALRLEVFAKLPRKDIEAAGPCLRRDRGRRRPVARDPVTSAESSATNPAMNLVRATFSYWYFSNGSRWQPEGRV